MIDVSDGLASEILHLSDKSKVGFRLYEEKNSFRYTYDYYQMQMNLT